MYNAGYGSPCYPDGWKKEDENHINGRVPRWQREQIKDDYEAALAELEDEIKAKTEKLELLQAQYDNFLEVKYA